MRPSRWAWLVVASLGVVVLQLTLADELVVDGVHMELVWVIPVAAGLCAGPFAGMAAGFVAGAIADLFVPTPFGLTALVAVVVGYALGRMGEEGVGDLGGAAWVVAPGLAAISGLLAPVLYALCGAAIGHHGYVHAHLLVVSALDAVACTICVRPAMRILGPVLADVQGRGSLEPVRGAM